MSSELEAAYRRLLKLYPPAYRRRREAEMLDVLLQSTPPGRRRPAVRDAADLLRGAARAWLSWLFVPDPAATRDGAAMLAIGLPLLHTAMAATVFARAFSGFVRFPGVWSMHAYLRFAWDWPAWLLWSLAAGCVVVGKARAARLASVLALALYVALLPQQYARFNADILAQGFVWIGTGTCLVLLLTPTRVARGRSLIGHFLLPALVTAVALGATRGGLLEGRDPGWAFHGPKVVLAVVVVASLAAVFAVRTPTGRAVVPPAGALAAFSVGIRALDTRGYGMPSDGPGVSVQALARLAALPIVAFVSLRLLVAIAERWSGDRS